jgi:hypothetical protein
MATETAAPQTPQRPVCRPLARLRRLVPYRLRVQILPENFPRKLLASTQHHPFQVAVSTTSPIESNSTRSRRIVKIPAAAQEASVKSRSFHPIHAGEMAEWLKAHAWKACLGETLTWVRIPLSPPTPL